MLKKVTVLYNAPDSIEYGEVAEADDDTQNSALGVSKGLQEIGLDVELLGVTTKDFREKITNINSDLVFNLIEWTGKNSYLGVQAIQIMSDLGIKYTGSHAFGYELSGDKREMKKLFDKENIPTPRWMVIKKAGQKISMNCYPMIVKPVLEHCAIGVEQSSVVSDRKALELQVEKLILKYGQPVLIEEFIDGYEAQVTVLSKHGKPWVLPPAIIKFKTKSGYKPILTYVSKWGQDKVESGIPYWSEEKDHKTLQLLCDLSLRCNEVAGGRSYARVDARISRGKVYILEINNNPGIDYDPNSGIAHSALAAGLTWHDLLRNIVTEAYAEFKPKASLERSRYDTIVV